MGGSLATHDQPSPIARKRGHVIEEDQCVNIPHASARGQTSWRYDDIRALLDGSNAAAPTPFPYCFGLIPSVLAMCATCARCSSTAAPSSVGPPGLATCAVAASRAPIS